MPTIMTIDYECALQLPNMYKVAHRRLESRLIVVVWNRPVDMSIDAFDVMGYWIGECVTLLLHGCKFTTYDNANDSSQGANLHGMVCLSIAY